MQNPFKFVKGIFQEKRSRTLECTKAEMENHLKKTYSDEGRETALPEMSGIPKPSAPGIPYDTGDIKMREVEEFLKKARSKSSPGQDGVPCKVYKKCPKLANRLFLILHKAWHEKKVAQCWTTAEGVYIPTEENSATLSQFRPISLLNTDSKIFFGILAKRTMSFLLANGYIDDSVQKVGLPGTPGCIERASMIWEAIQTAKKGKSHLVVVWLDLANAFGSISHKLIEYAMDLFWIPPEVIKIMMDYYNLFIMRFFTANFTTAWQRLEIGIAAGCTFSVIWFVLVMEVLLRGTKINEETLSISAPKKAFMNDVTLLTHSQYTKQATLLRLDELITWARMCFKAKKSRSVTFVNGKQKELNYQIAGESLLTIAEDPVKSLGRLYAKSLNDGHEGIRIQELAEDGLRKINITYFPGRFKVWCIQNALFPRLQWLLTLYEVALTWVERIEQRCNVYVRKWLGLPRMTSCAVIYSNKGPLDLPIPSIVESYKCRKVRAVMMLRYSNDAVVRAAPPDIKTGCKWKATEETDRCISVLQHCDIVGATQSSTEGLGIRRFRPFSSLNPKERRDAVVDQTKRVEEEKRYVHLVQSSQQGQYVAWHEKVFQRKLNWNDLWNWDEARISFLIRSVYDMLPSPANLFWWKISDSALCRCGKLRTMRHILSNCALGLTVTWCHNQVLWVLAVEIDKRLKLINSGKKPKVKRWSKIRFVTALKDSVPLYNDPDWEGSWKMSVDLDGQFYCLLETQGQRPDLVLWCEERKVIKFVGLTIPWETNIDDAWLQKDSRYGPLVEICEDLGWEAHRLPIEVGARGFVVHRVHSLLRQLGFTSKERKDLIKRMQETVEKASYFIWLKQDDERWMEK